MALGIDTNIIVYALNSESDVYERARRFLEAASTQSDVVIAEFVLVELYLLIRNPTVFPRPFNASDAADVCRRLRRNPRWQIVECRSVMDRVWDEAAKSGFPRRRIIDVRLAHTLHSAGVDRFATRNVGDFTDLGLFDVFDPLASPEMQPR